jgi:hypothetical protein
MKSLKFVYKLFLPAQSFSDTLQFHPFYHSWAYLLASAKTKVSKGFLISYRVKSQGGT